MNKKKNITIVYIILIIFFIVNVIFPVFSLFTRITSQSINSVINSSQFSLALKNSLLTTSISTIITLLLGFGCAYCIERTNIRHKIVFSIIFTLPMLIPSISHAFGLITIFGNNGIINNLLGFTIDIYGFNGIITASIMYAFPIAFLLFDNVLRYENGLQYKAAKTLGIPKINSFLNITLPFLKKTIISSFFAVFVMILTDYGIPLTIGGKTITLSSLLFNKAVSLIDYGSGSVIAIFLLIPGIIAFIFDILNSNNTSQLNVIEKYEISNGKATEIFSKIFCVLISVIIIFPLLLFCIIGFVNKYPIDLSFSLKHFDKLVSQRGLDYLVNSLFYSLLAAVLGTTISYLCAYFTTRIKSKISPILHFVSLLSMCVPGVVLGLSYVIFFNNSSIYGTFFIIILVNSIHFFSSPYLMMYNSFYKINANIEDAAKTLGISKVKLILDVFIPQTYKTIVDMFAYFFINSMMTISAVSFLCPPSSKPISLLINQFEAQRMIEGAALVSVLILVVNLVMKLFTTILNRKI